MDPQTKRQIREALAQIDSALQTPDPQPVAWRYWSTKWQGWEYADRPLQFPAVPAGTVMEPLYPEP